MRKKRIRRRLKLLMLCYLAAAVVWGAAGAFALAKEALSRNNGSMALRELALANAGMENIQVLDGWDPADSWIYSVTPDSQLVWDLGGAPAGLVVLDAEAYSPGGEMVLYYTTPGRESFSETQKQWARLDGAGRYVFDLGGQRIARLRLDPDTRGGVIWRVRSIMLNPQKPAWAFWLPDLQQGALLLFAPLALYAAAVEAWAFLQPVLVRRRFEKRWRETARPKASASERTD